MALLPPTVTLDFPASDLPAVLTRLTTYLLQQSYDFLQTSHAAGHVDFDVFSQQQPLVRLTLRAVEAGGSAPGRPTPVLPPTLAADAVALIHHLLRQILVRAG